MTINKNTLNNEQLVGLLVLGEQYLSKMDEYDLDGDNLKHALSYVEDELEVIEWFDYEKDANGQEFFDGQHQTVIGNFINNGVRLSYQKSGDSISGYDFDFIEIELLQSKAILMKEARVLSKKIVSNIENDSEIRKAIQDTKSLQKLLETISKI